MGFKNFFDGIFGHLNSAEKLDFFFLSLCTISSFLFSCLGFIEMWIFEYMDKKAYRQRYVKIPLFFIFSIIYFCKEYFYRGHIEFYIVIILLFMFIEALWIRKSKDNLNVIKEEYMREHRDIDT